MALAFLKDILEMILPDLADDAAELLRRSRVFDL